MFSLLGVVSQYKLLEKLDEDYALFLEDPLRVTPVSILYPVPDYSVIIFAGLFRPELIIKEDSRSIIAFITKGPSFDGVLRPELSPNVSSVV